MVQVKWTREEVEFVLQDKQWLSHTRERVLNANGVQFVLKDGTCVNWWPNRTARPQGKPSEVFDEANAIFSKNFSEYIPLPKPQIFVVYGHDKKAKDQIESIIKGFGLDPIILDQIPGVGNTIIEQLEKQIEGAVFACVLLTPDDEGHPKDKPDEKKYRARQNVILELGMVAGKLGRQQVAVFHKGELEMPSDIRDLIYIPFGDGDVEEAKKKLKSHLEQVGIATRI